MRRIVVHAFLVCLAVTTALSQQSALNGKWATSRPADPFEKWQNVQLELSIEGTTASGTLSIGGLGGTFHVLKDGKVAGNRVRFKTQPNPSSTVTFTIDLVDQNTVTVFQSLPELPLVSNISLELAGVLPGVQAAAPNPTLPRAPSNAPISGTVQDQSGANIPGVTLSLTRVDTGETFTATTDETGQYEFFNGAGTYRLTASLPGFKTATLNSVSIDSTPWRRDVTLQVGSGISDAASDPRPEPCVPDMARCTLLHRVR